METKREIQEIAKTIRNRYDNLHNRQISAIKRCHVTEDLKLESSYYTLIREFKGDLSGVVILFPYASQVIDASNFYFGSYLKNNLANLSEDSKERRFRQLVDSQDKDQLTHRLRGLLKISDSPVDWGVLGSDILRFFWQGGSVKKSWAEGFYG